MSDKLYTVNEIFYSLQGEGIRAGTANIFVRFSGCNQKCSVETHGFDCDTEWISGRKMTIQDILKFCGEIAPQCKQVIFTGGEPGLQLDEELLAAFHQGKFFTAVETNGTVDLWPFRGSGLLDWITMSPKVSEHSLKCLRCDEIKYVRAYGQGIPKPAARATFKLISPAFIGPTLDNRNLEWCINLVKENPDWQMSVQNHKLWRIR